MKTLALALMLIGCGDLEGPATPPMCEVAPLASTFAVDCGQTAADIGKKAVCRDAQGEIMYRDCLLPNGPTSLHCVETCE